VFAVADRSADRLTEEERQRRARRRARLYVALRNPPHCVIDPARAVTLCLTEALYPDVVALDWQAIGERAQARWRAPDPADVTARRAPGAQNRAPGRTRRAPVVETCHNRRAYAAATVQGVCTDIAHTPPGDRNNVLNRGAYKLGRLVTSQLVTEADALAVLHEAAARCGLGDREAHAVIVHALHDGMAMA
jgi:hypothetical protein